MRDLRTASIFSDIGVSWGVYDFIAQISAHDLILAAQQCLDQATQIYVDDQSQTIYNFQEEILITSAATYPIPESSLPLVYIDIRNANADNPCIRINPASADLHCYLHHLYSMSPNITLISMTLCLPSNLRSTVSFSEQDKCHKRGTSSIIQVEPG